WARQPDSRLRPLLLRRLYTYLATSPAAAGAFATSFFRQGLDRIHEPFFGHLPRWSVGQRSWNFFSDAMRDAIAGSSPEERVRAIMPEGWSGWSGLSRDQFIEASTLLPGYLLSSQGDRMTMANSVEGRYPFLDHRVIEFGN